MLQRVELARALVTCPEILYLDEPLGALDALTRLSMRVELRRLLVHKRCTTVMVTHDVEEALDLADKVIIFSPRPATIRLSMSVPFPHPRPLSHRHMRALKGQILEGLGLKDPEGRQSACPRGPYQGQGVCGKNQRGSDTTGFGLSTSDARRPLHGICSHLDACWRRHDV
jgi:hypothetical protein